MKTLTNNLNMVNGVYDGAVSCFIPKENTDYAQLLLDYCDEFEIDINEIDDNDFSSAVIALRDFATGAERVSFWVD